MVSIVYPYKGILSPEKIRGFFEDALADGRIPDEYRDAGDTATMARALDDIGDITVSKWLDDDDIDQYVDEPEVDDDNYSEYFDDGDQERMV